MQRLAILFWKHQHDISRTTFHVVRLIDTITEVITCLRVFLSSLSEHENVPPEHVPLTSGDGCI